LKAIPAQPTVAAIVMFLHLNVSSAHSITSHLSLKFIKAEARESTSDKQHLISIMDPNLDQSVARVPDADTIDSQPLKIKNAV